MRRISSSPGSFFVRFVRLAIDLFCLVPLPLLLTAAGVFMIRSPSGYGLIFGLPIEQVIASVLFASALLMILNSVQKQRSLARLRNLLTDLTILVDVSPKWEKDVVLQAFMIAVSRAKGKRAQLGVSVFSMNASPESPHLLYHFPNDATMDPALVEATKVAAERLNKGADAIYLPDTDRSTAIVIQRGGEEEPNEPVDLAATWSDDSNRYKSILWMVSNSRGGGESRQICALSANRKNFLDEALINAAKIGFGLIARLSSAPESDSPKIAPLISAPIQEPMPLPASAIEAPKGETKTTAPIPEPAPLPAPAFEARRSGPLISPRVRESETLPASTIEVRTTEPEISAPLIRRSQPLPAPTFEKKALLLGAVLFSVALSFALRSPEMSKPGPEEPR